MAVKHKDRKMKVIEDDDKECGLKLHKTNCDTLYRWSMWRMYLNEELSRVISARRDHLDYSNTVFSVTSPYIRHPDGKKYGHQMKKLFNRNTGHSKSNDILSDNVYLVYGLPRVSLTNRVPEDVRKLHESVNELFRKRDKLPDDSIGADEHISKLFDFVTSDEENNQCQVSVRHLGQTPESSKTKDDLHTKKQNVLSSSSTTNDDRNSMYLTTKSEKHIPPVSKSRLFWERLANKKSDIIEMDQKKLGAIENHEHAGISDEILQKQQKLLKKPTSKRTSKDLWRTLRERKTEILQLREMTPSQKNEHGHHLPTNQVKRRESKTSQLWGFIFHKKKELVLLKRGHNVSHDAPKSCNETGKKGLNIEFNDSKSKISPRNFEDTFQKELAERLRKRRNLIQSTQENTE